MSPWKLLMKVRRKTRQTKARSREDIFLVQRRKNPRFIMELPLDYRIEREGRYGGITANASIEGYEID
jgi:hypothetical protein